MYFLMPLVTTLDGASPTMLHLYYTVQKHVAARIVDWRYGLFSLPC